MSRAWMPLYIGDYLADTQHLMAQESGAYLHLIMHYWLNGSLTSESEKQRRIAKVHPAHWRKVRTVLEPFFDVTMTPGLWLHHRVELELTKNAELSRKRKAAAEQKLSNSSANAEQLHTQSQSPLPSKEGRKDIEPALSAAPSKRASPKFLLPENWHPAEDLSSAEAFELEKMRDWARANAIRRSDWFAQWRNWKRNAGKFGGGNGAHSQVRSGKPTLNDYFDRRIAELEERDSQENGADCESPRKLGRPS